MSERWMCACLIGMYFLWPSFTVPVAVVVIAKKVYLVVRTHVQNKKEQLKRCKEKIHIIIGIDR